MDYDHEIRIRDHKIAALEKRIGELTGKPVDDDARFIKETMTQALGLVPAVARVVFVLWKAGDARITVNDLMRRLGYSSETHVRVYIGQVRDALGTNAISTQHGVGYKLDVVHVAVLDELYAAFKADRAVAA